MAATTDERDTNELEHLKIRGEETTNYLLEITVTQFIQPGRDLFG
jgi:hypothetical protein